HRRHAGAPPSSGAPQRDDERNDRPAPDARDRPDDSSDVAKNDATASQGDWGYLPPEPAGLRDVKGVVPLPLKKR
ncbi:magnesium chelatase, partial [Burkholderia contaminans]